MPLLLPLVLLPLASCRILIYFNPPSLKSLPICGSFMNQESTLPATDPSNAIFLSVCLSVGLSVSLCFLFFSLSLSLPSLSLFPVASLLFELCAPEGSHLEPRQLGEFSAHMDPSVK